MAISDSEYGRQQRRQSLILLRSRRLSPSFATSFSESSPLLSLSDPHPPFMFPPDGRVISIWSLFMIVITLYQVMTIPYFIAFEGSETLFSVSADFVCFLFFCVDIVVSFNVGFYVRGELCTSRRMVAGRYAKSWLVPDIVSTFPYQWLLQSPFDVNSSSSYKAPSLIRILKIFRLLRSFRILRLVKIGRHFMLLQQKLSNELSLFITFCTILTVMGCIAHWAACGFYFMSQLSETPQNWVSAVNIENATDGDKYVMALYWAVTTLTTTGFGDVVPVNSYERLYGIVLMVLSAGVFSFLIGKIATVITNVERSVNEHREMVLQISRYLKEADVPEEVRFRALRYVDYKWETRKSRKVLDKTILSQFSEPLKDEISEHIFGTIIGRVPLIGKFEHSFVSQLAKNVEPEIYAVSDCIFSEDIASTDMYFLEKGRVEMYHEGTKFVYAVLQSGQHFGELAFITGSQRTASARCIQYAEVLRLHRDPFLELVSLSPSAKYTLQVTRNIVESKNMFDLGINCYLCRSYSHLAVECKEAKIHIDREKIQRKWLDGSRLREVAANKRKVFARRIRKIKVVKSYKLRNVKAEGSSSPVLEPSRSSSLDSIRIFTKPKPPPPLIDILPPTERSLLHTEEIEDAIDATPRSPGKRHYSFFRGVKTYALQSSVPSLMARLSGESHEFPAQ